MLGVHNPKLQLEPEPIGFKRLEEGARSRIGQHAWARERGRLQHLLHRAHIDLGAQDNARAQQHMGVVEREVFNALGEQLLIGHNGLSPTIRPNQGKACFDVGDLALKVINFDDVANANRALEQNHKTTHVIGSELLHPQPQTDAKCAPQDRERRQV